jgi:hypothetical protein
MRLEQISREQFEAWQPCQKIIVHDHARRFGALRPPGERTPTFALSWRSDSIEPMLVAGVRDEIWVGIDQRVACVSGDGRIVLSLGLASSFLGIHCFANAVVVLCETEALVFNSDCSIRANRGLAGLPTDVLDQDGVLVLTLEDGRRETLG